MMVPCTVAEGKQGTGLLKELSQGDAAEIGQERVNHVIIDGVNVQDPFAHTSSFRLTFQIPMLALVLGPELRR